MDNGALGALAYLEGNANLPGIQRSPDIEPGAQTESLLQESGENRVTDIVEFSGESIQLSQAAGNQQAQEAAAGIAESDNSTDQNPDNQNTGTVTLTTVQPGGVGETATETATVGLQGVDNTTNNTPAPETTNGAIVGEYETEERLASNEEIINTTIANSPRTAASTIGPQNEPQTVLQQTEEPVINTNTDTTAGAAAVPENENTAQAQAQRLTDIEANLEAARGDRPSESPITEVDRAQQGERYQEQLLLQDVTSQMAQTVPVATVVNAVAG